MDISSISFYTIDGLLDSSAEFGITLSNTNDNLRCQGSMNSLNVTTLLTDRNAQRNRIRNNLRNEHSDDLENTAPSDPRGHSNVILNSRKSRCGTSNPPLGPRDLRHVCNPPSNSFRIYDRELSASMTAPPRFVDKMLPPTVRGVIAPSSPPQRVPSPPHRLSQSVHRFDVQRPSPLRHGREPPSDMVHVADAMPPRPPSEALPFRISERAVPIEDAWPQQPPPRSQLLPQPTPDAFVCGIRCPSPTSLGPLGNSGDSAGWTGCARRLPSHALGGFVKDTLAFVGAVTAFHESPVPDCAPVSAVTSPPFTSNGNTAPAAVNVLHDVVGKFLSARARHVYPFPAMADQDLPVQQHTLPLPGVAAGLAVTGGQMLATPLACTRARIRDTDSRWSPSCEQGQPIRYDTCDTGHPSALPESLLPSPAPHVAAGPRISPTKSSFTARHALPLVPESPVDVSGLTASACASNSVTAGRATEGARSCESGRWARLLAQRLMPDASPPTVDVSQIQTVIPTHAPTSARIDVSRIATAEVPMTISPSNRTSDIHPDSPFVSRASSSSAGPSDTVGSPTDPLVPRGATRVVSRPVPPLLGLVLDNLDETTDPLPTIRPSHEDTSLLLRTPTRHLTYDASPTIAPHSALGAAKRFSSPSSRPRSVSRTGAADDASSTPKTPGTDRRWRRDLSSRLRHLRHMYTLHDVVGSPSQLAPSARRVSPMRHVTERFIGSHHPSRVDEPCPPSELVCGSLIGRAACPAEPLRPVQALAPSSVHVACYQPSGHSCCHVGPHHHHHNPRPMLNAACGQSPPPTRADAIPADGARYAALFRPPAPPIMGGTVDDHLAPEGHQTSALLVPQRPGRLRGESVGSTSALASGEAVTAETTAARAPVLSHPLAPTKDHACDGVSDMPAGRGRPDNARSLADGDAADHDGLGRIFRDRTKRSSNLSHSVNNGAASPTLTLAKAATMRVAVSISDEDPRDPNPRGSFRDPLLEGGNHHRSPPPLRTDPRDEHLHKLPPSLQTALAALAAAASVAQRGEPTFQHDRHTRASSPGDLTRTPIVPRPVASESSSQVDPRPRSSPQGSSVPSLRVDRTGLAPTGSPPVVLRHRSRRNPLTAPRIAHHEFVEMRTRATGSGAGKLMREPRMPRDPAPALSSPPQPLRRPSGGPIVSGLHLHAACEPAIAAPVVTTSDGYTAQLVEVGGALVRVLRSSGSHARWAALTSQPLATSRSREGASCMPTDLSPIRGNRPDPSPRTRVPRMSASSSFPLANRRNGGRCLSPSATPQRLRVTVTDASSEDPSRPESARPQCIPDADPGAAPLASRDDNGRTSTSAKYYQLALRRDGSRGRAQQGN